MVIKSRVFFKIIHKCSVAAEDQVKFALQQHSRKLVRTIFYQFKADTGIFLAERS